MVSTLSAPMRSSMETPTQKTGTPDRELDYENQLARLLEDLTRLQTDLLQVLGEKRRYMATADRAGMAELQQREQQLCDQLQQCHDRRGALLAQVGAEGLAVGSLGDLAGVLQRRGRRDLRSSVRSTSSRMRLLQHNCLANWVLAQKALLHASQMLEIIATGGRLQATYGDTAGRTAGGALVDQEV